MRAALYQFLIFLLLDVDVDDSYVYSKAEQICSANLPFFLVKPLEVTWNLPQQHHIFIDISIHFFFIVSYSENDSFEMWAHNYWNFENFRWLLFCPHIYQPILGNIDGDFVICLEYMEHTWHKNSNQISIIQVLVDIMQKSGECAPRDEVCPRKIRWKMLAMASTGPHRQQKSLKCVPFRRFTSCDANRQWTRVGASAIRGSRTL